MENSDLIYQIVDLYGEARKTHFPNKNIIRSKSHSVSSKVEDVIAYYFSLFTDDSIVIDRPFKYDKNETSKTFAPDITIYRDNHILQFFDVKMDLGWKRKGFIEYCIERGEEIKNMKINKSIKYKNEEFSLSEKVKYNIIIISDRNNSKKNLKEISEKIDLLKNMNLVDVYFLTSAIHPNEWDLDKTKKEIVINHEEFKRLKLLLK